MRAPRGCPTRACDPGESPGHPASVFSVKQEDKSDSNHVPPLLSLRTPTGSCPACRKSSGEKEEPPQEGSGVLVSAAQDKLSGNNCPTSPHVPFRTFGKSAPGYEESLELVAPHSAHWG